MDRRLFNCFVRDRLTSGLKLRRLFTRTFSALLNSLKNFLQEGNVLYRDARNYRAFEIQRNVAENFYRRGKFDEGERIHVCNQKGQGWV